MTSAPATDPFDSHRRFLTRLAYRMLGSVSDAEDIVQEAWLRWRESERAEIAQPRAFLARIVTRLCLDQMKSARSRREFYVGSWLPEPLVEALGGETPADAGLDAPIALMLALERLSPLERAAFLLHDIFEMDFAEIARTIDRSESACRQLAKRAREHVRIDMPPRNKVDPVEAKRFVDAFFKAAHKADPSDLQALLAQDVAFHSDGGGKVLAVINPLYGIDRVSRFFAGINAKLAHRDKPTRLFKPVLINGLPGYLSLERGETLQATALDIRDGRVQAIYIVRNPDKLRHLDLSDG
ncbi:sigma-70 family RNA polymerase sigma factor [Bosea sp. (in: a-proteobacteria)]|jgi:RNA polymerase sigma-70 factor (ECF subfamily)|uniref:sigma-70 family RNA polymerase sigma factor n=1 Tax=Bosea sp. (in: a-proteobacteria) TaxID=1871050 RepID=UPI001AC13334|nr:sigma-70 family RNA polymerase sigma factor [Bosea sp. (in: a-proteobacteria)]MBN9439058.1 sigma-70 family RNA polymerase sigma factor [Bosea sp. (in: a-proteobacteria)]